MLACVCQPAETRLYTGGRVTPRGPLGGPGRPLHKPRGAKTRPPKPLPKPQSYSTTSEDTRSSPSEGKKSGLLSLKKIEEMAKTTKISSVSSIGSIKSLNASDSPKNSLKSNGKEGACLESAVIDSAKSDIRTNEEVGNDKTKSKQDTYKGENKKKRVKSGRRKKDRTLDSKLGTSSENSEPMVESDVNSKMSPKSCPNSDQGCLDNLKECFMISNKIGVHENSGSKKNGSAKRLDPNIPDVHRNNQFNERSSFVKKSLTKNIGSNVKKLSAALRKDNRERLLKTASNIIRVETRTFSAKDHRPKVKPNSVGSKNIVTITDNNGKIFCVDNMILVDHDVLGRMEEETCDDDTKRPSFPVKKLTVKNKTEEDDRLEEKTLKTGTKTFELPEGVELTLGELRAMALRQQQQIDCQHQLLAAREQRLRFLKHQEARHHQVAAENERLRRLRERVEAQELKLRRLRALRGQLDQTNLNNVALTSDLESIRALFNEKEKELSVAVAKVEELTRQLEEVRRGRAPPRAQPPAALELDKLRRELMYRNKLNEQQNARLSQQREALTARQAEMASIDQRISELQGRLHRKRVANRQLKHQPRSGNSAPVQLSNYPNSGSGGNNGGIKPQGPRGNVAAVEPYNHIPHPQNMQHAHNIQALKHNAAQNNHPIKLANQGDVIGSHLTQQEAHYLQQKQFTNQVYANGAYQQRLQGNLLQNDNQNNQGYPGKNSDITGYPGQQNDQKNLLEHIKYNVELQKNALTTVNHNQVRKSNVDQETIPEFAASKSDPKYQTLPYNTKFTSNSKAKQFYDESKTNEHGIVKVSSSSNLINLNHMTAHSTPLTISKGLATPLSPNDGNSGYHGNEMLQGYHKSEAGYHGNDVGGNSSSGYQLQRSESGGVCNEDKENQGHVREGKEQGKAQGGRAELVRGFSQQSTVTSTGQMKPVSSVAPTSVQVSSGKPSPIYQTSSTKIQPVQPQTVVSSVGAGARGVLSPQGSSTPETADKQVPRPALPPKPPAKLQPSSHESSPASSQSFQDSSREPAVPPVPTSDPPNDQQTNNNLSPNPATSSEGQPMIIKARPLTIKKQPLSEQPKLRNQSSSIVKSNASVMTTSRRAEMSSAFEANQEFNKSNKLSNNNSSSDVTDRMVSTESETSSEDQGSVGNITDQMSTVDLSNGNGEGVVRRIKKGNLKQTGRMNLSRRVSFDPLALLLDASLEGELELVKKTATQVANPSAANDEGITALHNAICAGHFEIVKFLVEFGCDVNAQDSDGWTPLHCAASCNNVAMVRFLVENGACIFATTLSDHETAAQKCEEDEEGFDGCSEYLYSVQEKLGIMNGGCVYAVFAYTAQEPDELSFPLGARLGVLRKGDEAEREWWWARHAQEGYVPRNLLGLYPRVTPPKQEQ